jgi:hypothetical protein
MAKPASREEFIEYCLRKLGKPVLEINVDNDQVEDRVDEALAYYHDYHFDGAQKIYLAHQITEQDQTNKYITIPENIIGVINIFDVGDSYSTNNLFNLRYQISLNDLYAFSSTRYAPYYMAFQNIALAEELFVGKQSLRYNRHVNKLYIDMAWSEKTTVGEYIIVEAYEAVDPDTYSDVWKDRWLQNYATQLIKRQWGDNLKKFEGMTMPGGVTFNGQKIWDEANEEITKLEAEMISTFSLPVSDMVG